MGITRMFQCCISMFIHIIKGVYLYTPISLNLLKSLTHLRTSLQPSLHRGRDYCTDTSTGRSTVIVQNSLQGTYRSSLLSLAHGEVEALPPHTCLIAQFKSMISKTTPLESLLFWTFLPETNRRAEGRL